MQVGGVHRETHTDNTITYYNPKKYKDGDTVNVTVKEVIETTTSSTDTGKLSGAEREP